MPNCRNCGELIYIRFVCGLNAGWHHWKSGAICCGDIDQGDERMAEPETMAGTVYEGWDMKFRVIDSVEDVL